MSSKCSNGFPFALSIILLLMLFAPGVSHGQSPPSDTAPMVVGGDRAYPPYEFLDENGWPSGFNVELTQAIAEVMGMKVEIRLGAWSDMRQALDDGTIDVLQGISYSAERAHLVDFSPPFAIVHHSIYARKGTSVVSSLQELSGKTVIVQKGGIAHDDLLQSGLAVNLVLRENAAETLRLLASGEGDYAVVAMVPAEFLVRELGLTNIVPVARRIQSREYCYAVKKGNSELLARFAEGLAILEKTGRYQEIHRKWLGVLDQRGVPWGVIARYGAVIMVPLLLLLAGAALWSHTLHRQVAQRTQALSLEIAERQRAEEELRQRQEQLIQADKMSALGILVSGVAHEINNPSGLILLNTPILLDAFQDAEPILEAYYQKRGDFTLGGLRYSRMREEIPQLLSEMLEGAKRIKRIVEDLKDFARRTDSGLTDEVDLNTIVQTSVRLVEHLIKKSTNHFRVDYAAALPPVRGSAQRIEQVVVNLVMNACQALPDQERGIALKTFHDRQGDAVVLEVRDQGTGIASEHLPHLADPFFTTKRESGGTGLGLSLSAAIVTEHRGTLTFQSPPGEGTIARLTLPISGEDD
ncbi:MAG: transporter substrate-binding domain-containing protein [Syntrophobacteraceae bacterium]